MTAMHLKALREVCKSIHHSVWRNVISRHQRTKSIGDNIKAGYRIPGILTGIVLFGLVSMVSSVWLTF
jgi:hypothetical protein